MSTELTAAQRAHGTWVMTLTRMIARLLASTLMRLRIEGIEQLPAAGGVLLAINHSAFVDGPLAYGTVRRPSVFLIKIEMFRGPLGRLLRRIGQIPVRRGTAERGPIVASLDTLAAGGVIGVFPEGTRGVGDVSRVEHGIAFLALRSGCPVVPVACIGTAAVFPKGRKLPRWRQPVRVVFGEPFVISHGEAGPTRRTVAEAAEEIRIVLAKHVAHAAGDPEPKEHDE